MAQAKVGVVGLGNMGRGVTGNLHKAKTPLMVWDVAPEAREPWEKKTRRRGNGAGRDGRSGGHHLLRRSGLAGNQ